ncbi:MULTISPECIES: MCE family protein [Pseudonocardia]|uniref:MCE family protein n=1 Tax=Pseudonocardia abyssalis TaxID=2792008 RepID=A0ABS6V1B0_9PSEU|nr:MCE family protein [Pseudonocardia abyssalis]MBW0114265.1 MCE family protein [Pseudonocardia abyssalis]MBW0138308.1 MCE family protein [Pseudonocardia abyssalis]
MSVDLRGVVAPLVKMLVFIVVTAVATTGLAIVITNYSPGDRTSYTARFTDVTGLVEGDDVRIAGVRVGSVEDIRVVEQTLAEVRFTVLADRSLPGTSTAAIRYRNLVGQRYLAIGRGDAAPGPALEPGATIPLERTTGPLNLTALLNGFRPLFQALSPQDVNQLSYEIIQVLQGEGGTIRSLLTRTADLTGAIADRDAVIGEVITNFDEVLGTVADRDTELGAVLTQLQQLVSGLAEDRRPIGDAVAALGELTDTTAGLLDEARPALRSDIAALGDLSRRLADQEGEIEPALQNLPIKAEKMVRNFSQGGSFFSLFLCSVSTQIGWSAMGIEPVQLTDIYPDATVLAPQPRCVQ